MILTADQAAHNSWISTCLKQGIPRSDYKAFCRGFNEGAAHALEAYLKVAPVVPIVPTVDTVRALFCEQVKSRWSRERLRNILGNLLP